VQYGGAMRALFWLSAGLLAYAQAGYGLLLAVLTRSRGAAAPAHMTPPAGPPPDVTLIVAAYREEAVIADKVRNALALDWPRDRLQLIVAVDGGAEPDPERPDATARLAREAGADLVLELPRGGKMRSQDAAVAAARGELLAFSDANAVWEPDALRRLAGAFEDPEVAYACGQVRFVNDEGTNQEGLYWRYEMWLRARESALASVTGGNGAIYAVRREDYVVPPIPMGHDLLLPFTLVQRGRRAVYVPDARASEKMVPTIEGEWARKRRMMTQAWPIVLRGGLLRLGAYPPLYALMISSHRILRYAAPLLHVLALVSALALSRRRLYALAAAAQLALVAAAVAGGRVRSRPLLIARYYVLTTASVAAGLADHLRHGTPQGWEPAEGTR
jgi:cellulose synthase/poly-beta-1,6-N-acetylglucosamine synthase-like glycosyltransferase